MPEVEPVAGGPSLALAHLTNIPSPKRETYPARDTGTARQARRLARGQRNQARPTPTPTSRVPLGGSTVITYLEALVDERTSSHRDASLNMQREGRRRGPRADRHREGDRSPDLETALRRARPADRARTTRSSSRPGRSPTLTSRARDEPRASNPANPPRNGAGRRSSTRRGVSRSSSPTSSAPTTGTASPAGVELEGFLELRARSRPANLYIPHFVLPPVEYTTTAPLLEVVGHVMVSTGVVDWVEVGGDPIAAVVPEGTAKPEAAFTVTPKTAALDTIAHWVQITRQALEDATYIRSLIENKLRRGLLNKAETDMAAAIDASTRADGDGDRGAGRPARGDPGRDRQGRRRPGSTRTPSPSTRPTTPRSTSP